MGATESPLTDILAQLRARTETWAQASASARATLAEEVRLARAQLASDDVATAVQAAEARARELQGELAEAQGHTASLQARLDGAEHEITELRAALGELEMDLAALKLREAQRLDPAALAQAQAAHAAELAARDAAIAQRDDEIAQRDRAIAAHIAALAEARAELDRREANAGRAAAAQALLASGIPAFDDHGHKRRMGTILVEANVLSPAELTAALAEQASNPQRRLGTIVVERGYTNEELVARILAAQLRLPFAKLDPAKANVAAVKSISGHLARLHKAIPIDVQDEVLTVAMANPLDLIAIEDIEIASKRRVEPVVATRSAIEALLAGLS